jgi:cell wall-associated NlpC family hydrolase
VSTSLDARLRAAVGPLIGVPFVHRGRDPAIGLDCWGLVLVVYRQAFAIELPDFPDADGSRANRAHAAMLIREQSQLWLTVTPGTEDPADVIVLERFRRPLHVGLVLGERRMAHCDAETGVSCPRYDGLAWRNQVLGFYRHPLLARF